MQALSDESVAVVTEAIRFLTSVVEDGHIRKRALLAISGRLVAKLQQHTSTAVLSAAADFMAAASRCALCKHLCRSGSPDHREEDCTKLIVYTSVLTIRSSHQNRVSSRIFPMAL